MLPTYMTCCNNTYRINKIKTTPMSNAKYSHYGRYYYESDIVYFTAERIRYNF